MGRVRLLRLGSIHLFRQPCLQVCNWLSQALKQGVLNVIGQTRLQDAFSLAQFAKHASAAASATRILLKPMLFVPATAVPSRETRSAAPNASLIEKLLPSLLCPRLRGLFWFRFRMANHKLLDRMTGLESGSQPARPFSAP